jgi:hypothetical protein
MKNISVRFEEKIVQLDSLKEAGDGSAGARRDLAEFLRDRGSARMVFLQN